jgi:hypothetical protein
MARLVLSWVNHVDADATILSASEENGDFRVANLANPIIGRRWRALSLTAWAQADFGADVAIAALALRFCRDTAIPLAGTVTHTLDADGGTPGTGAVYGPGATAIGTADGYGYHFHKLAAEVSARYWRFTFDLSGVSFADVGRAWAGQAWQPSRNYAVGAEDEWRDLSKISVAPRSGAEFPDERPRQRVFRLELPAILASERDTARELGRIAGTSQQILLALDPDDASRETVIGRLEESTALRRIARAAIYGKNLAVRESL